MNFSTLQTENTRKIKGGGDKMKEIRFKTCYVIFQKLIFASVAEITLIGAGHSSELYVQHKWPVSMVGIVM
jgi:hypothetical protein